MGRTPGKAVLFAQRLPQMVLNRERWSNLGETFAQLWDTIGYINTFVQGKKINEHPQYECCVPLPCVFVSVQPLRRIVVTLALALPPASHVSLQASR